MGNFNFIETKIKDLYIIEPKVFGDDRGYFMESYNREAFVDAGLDMIFVQDNESFSKEKGVLRGLHFQMPPYTQAKLVRFTQGMVYDVVVDIRKDSPTYKQYTYVELTPENGRQLFIPRGFAHGFVVLSEEAEFTYKCTDFYHPNDEGGLLYNDPEIGVEWPIPEGMELIMSEKDQKWANLAETFHF